MSRELRQTAKEVLLAFREAAYFVFLALRSLCFWRKPPPVTTPAELLKFVESRAKAVTQVTLFSYLKTRAGTRYTSLFEDDVFANSISIAIWEIYPIALSDLAVFVAARIGRMTEAGVAETESLAIFIHESILGAEEVPAERPRGFDEAIATFRERAATTAWLDMADGEGAFRGSLNALVEWAPVAPELKNKDTVIVENSMRFKWKAVREQFTNILDAEAVMAAWRAGDRNTAESGAAAAPTN